MTVLSLVSAWRILTPNDLGSQQAVWAKRTAYELRSMTSIGAFAVP